MSAIETLDLTREFVSETGYIFKKRENIMAVDHVNFTVESGELFGFVGPNGAGKTTTVKMLCTLLLPTSGTARVLGHDIVDAPNAVRARINVIFGGERGLYWRLSGRDNLRYFATLYGMDPTRINDRIDELMAMVGLFDRADEKFEKYSRGMKQRLHIAKGLLNDPEVVFMDEPTQGLDPEISHELRKVIADLAKGGKTIFLTTHYMFEADELCRRVAVINHGQIVALDSPQNLKKHVAGQRVIEAEFFGAAEKLVEEMRQMPDINLITTEVVEQRKILKIQTATPASVVPKLTEKLSSLKMIDLRIREPTLEDAYLKLVGAA